MRSPRAIWSRAESYLQHAEHYNRIIMAAQSQLGPQHGGHPGEGANGGGGFRPRWNADGSDSLDEGGEMDGPDAMSGVNEVLSRGRREQQGHRGRQWQRGRRPRFQRLRPGRPAGGG